MSLRVEPLTDHDVSSFACGNYELDEWLHRHARTATGQGTRTYVLVEGGGPVVGYFAIAPHFLAREDASSRLARGAPHQIPAILLAKLALDATVQGRGLGAELLVHALDTILSAARHPLYSRDVTLARSLEASCPARCDRARPSRARDRCRSTAQGPPSRPSTLLARSRQGAPPVEGPGGG